MELFQIFRLIEGKEKAMVTSNWFVIGLGMGTVFFGLICLIVICKITSFFCGIFEKKEEKPAQTEPVSNKQEILAAVCTVIAEETGAEAKNIRVLSFKKI